jgi:predicted dehydrogenase
MGGFYRLQGPWGFLQMNSYTYQGQHIFGHYASAREVNAPWIEFDEMSTEKDPMQFVRQVDHFSDCILRDREPNPPGEEGLADMRAVEGVYGAAGA